MVTVLLISTEAPEQILASSGVPEFSSAARLTDKILGNSSAPIVGADFRASQSMSFVTLASGVAEQIRAAFSALPATKCRSAGAFVEANTGVTFHECVLPPRLLWISASVAISALPILASGFVPVVK